MRNFCCTGHFLVELRAFSQRFCLFFLLLSLVVLGGCHSVKTTSKPVELDEASLSTIAKSPQKQQATLSLKEEQYSFPQRLKSAIKPNIDFDDKSDGNNATELLVTLNKESRVVSVKLTASSGNKAWDAAVVAGVWKTKVFPKDIDGTVHPKLLLVLRPKD